MVHSLPSVTLTFDSKAGPHFGAQLNVSHEYTVFYLRTFTTIFRNLLDTRMREKKREEKCNRFHVNNDWWTATWVAIEKRECRQDSKP